MSAIDRAQAERIVAEECRALGLVGRDEPAISDEGELTDGVWSEPAALGSEAALREQVRVWAKAVRS